MLAIYYSTIIADFFMKEPAAKSSFGPLIPLSSQGGLVLPMASPLSFLFFSVIGSTFLKGASANLCQCCDPIDASTG